MFLRVTRAVAMVEGVGGTVAQSPDLYLVLLFSNIPIAQLSMGHKSSARLELQKRKKHTTAGIRWWLPTQLLIC